MTFKRDAFQSFLYRQLILKKAVKVPGQPFKASFKGLRVFHFQESGHAQKARQDHLQHDGPTTEVFDSSVPFRGKLLFPNGACKENNLHSRLNKLQRRKCRCLHSIHAAFSISTYVLHRNFCHLLLFLLRFSFVRSYLPTP